jgi:predicted ester cyclase
MSAENKRTVQRLYDEVITAGEIEFLNVLVADDATGFGERGREVFVKHIRALQSGVANARATVTDMVAEGERVVVFWRLEGIHAGTLWNVPASGRSIDGGSVSLITLREGQIVDYKVLADRLLILQQIGALAG